MSKPDCYKCKHRKNSSWTTHSRCSHPEALTFDVRDALRVRAVPHGVRNGYFLWPADFDPVWLLGCNGFEPAEGGGAR